MHPRSLILDMTRRFRDSGVPDPEVDSAVLLSFLCARSPLELRLDMETEIGMETVEQYTALCERRIRREPLQYITGETPFCGRIFTVDRSVLIPRPETEELCRWALDVLPHGARVLDLCCGSGCIGLTLASERPDLSVTLSDLSADALHTAEINASRLGVRVSFSQSDLLSVFPDASFGCIVSNPPYIPSGECGSLQSEVQFEPLLALDGGADGLAVYRRIVPDAARVLKEGGVLMMELGYGEAESVAALLESSGYTEIEIRKDLSGISRMISAVCPAWRH